MWNKPKILKIKIHSQNTKISIPIPLFIFHQLLDCTMDLLALITFIIPGIKITIKNKKYNLKEILKTVYKILEIINKSKHCEPFDFVDIKTKEDIVKISLN